MNESEYQWRRMWTYENTPGADEAMRQFYADLAAFAQDSGMMTCRAPIPGEGTEWEK